MAYLLSRENEQELCSFCRFSGTIIRGPNRSEKDCHLCRWDVPMFSQISRISDLIRKFWAKRCGLYAGVYGIVYVRSNQLWFVYTLTFLMLWYPSVYWHEEKSCGLKNLFIWKVHIIFISFITFKIIFLAEVAEKSSNEGCNVFIKLSGIVFRDFYPVLMYYE